MNHDSEELRLQIEQLKANKKLENQVIQKTSQQQETEKEVLKLRDELQKATPELRKNFRNQLKNALQEFTIAEDEKQRVTTATRSIKKNINIGMSAQEVV
jgi:hypothetical protein